MNILSIPLVAAGKVRPRWSVMIPCCDPNPDLLRETIDSILQSGLHRTRAQIALVDDGTSAENFAACLELVASRDLELHRNPHRLGLVSNWNRCLQLSTGELIHILHQDDRILPGFYDAMEKGFAENPEIGAAFCQTAFIDGDGRRQRMGHMPERSAGVLHDWIQHVMINLTVACPGIAVHRRVYEEIGGYSAAYTYCPDYEMWQRIAVAFPVWYEPRPLAEYREHQASATHRLFSLGRRWRERRACLLEAAARLPLPVRRVAVRGGLHYQARLAVSEYLHQARRYPWSKSTVGSWRPLLRHIAPADLVAILRGRYPPDLPGGTVERDSIPGGVRPRVPLITEVHPIEALGQLVDWMCGVISRRGGGRGL